MPLGGGGGTGLNIGGGGGMFGGGPLGLGGGGSMCEGGMDMDMGMLGCPWGWPGGLMCGISGCGGP